MIIQTTNKTEKGTGAMRTPPLTHPNGQADMQNPSQHQTTVTFSKHNKNVYHKHHPEPLDNYYLEGRSVPVNTGHKNGISITNQNGDMNQEAHGVPEIHIVPK
jgi:hypothetical protein